MIKISAVSGTQEVIKSDFFKLNLAGKNYFSEDCSRFSE